MPNRIFIQRSSRGVWRMLAPALAVTFTACGSSDSLVTPSDQQVVSGAVAIFAHLADSVSRSSGDSTLSIAYASVAEAVRQAGRVSPIVVSVDGTPTAFLATAQQTEITVPAIACPVTAVCATPGALPPLHSIIAWQVDDPRRIVQLSSVSNADSIGAYLTPVLVPFGSRMASLIFFDGKGGTFLGTSGSQSFAVTTSTTACAAASGGVPSISIFAAPPTCTQADFTVGFSAKAEPAALLGSRNTAVGSHTFQMASQPVLGSRFQLSAALFPLPPIKALPGLSLPATLTAKVDSVVTLTLTIGNPSSTPAQVQFTSGKHYDFTVNDATTGALVWRWGIGVFFTQLASTESIPANGTLVYTATWRPRSGNFTATGSLVSASHRADAKATFVVP